MESSEKEKILTELINKLHEGVPEEEVKKEFLHYFPNAEENSWEKSLHAAVPELKNNTDITQYQMEKDPLVLLAEENGALRALIRNIQFDIQGKHNDEVYWNMISYEMERLSSIRYHYEKMQRLFIPLLKEKGVEDLDVVIEKENDVVSSIAELREERRYDEKDVKDRILELLSCIESNIVYENHFLLPILDGTFTEEEKIDLLLRELSIGLTLIRGVNIL